MSIIQWIGYQYQQRPLEANIGGVGQPLIFLNTETDDIGLNASNVAAKVDEVAQWGR